MEKANQQLDNEREMRKEYWEEINKISNQIIKKYNLNEKNIADKNKGHEICEIVYEIIRKSEWIENILKSFVVIQTTNHFSISIQSMVEEIENNLKQFASLLPNVACCAMSTDTLEKIKLKCNYVEEE